MHSDEKLSAFVEIAGDDFPVVFHADGFCRFCSPDSNEKVSECPTLMQWTIHAYKVQPRKDKRGVDLISDVLPFGRLWYGKSNAVENVQSATRCTAADHRLP